MAWPWAHRKGRSRNPRSDNAPDTNAWVADRPWLTGTSAVSLGIDETTCTVREMVSLQISCTRRGSGHRVTPMEVMSAEERLSAHIRWFRCNHFRGRGVSIGEGSSTIGRKGGSE
jgi:hypothetical protein